MSHPLTTLLVDNHQLVREGLKATIRRCPDFKVVGEAGDGAEAVSEAIRLRPNLVVMDIRMDGMDGIEACRQIRSELPGTHVLMLTSYRDERAVLASLAAGAGGFLLKDIQTDRLLHAMRIVGNGGSILDDASAATVVATVRQGNIVTDEDRLLQRLTDRELEILDLIAEGLTNREIGSRLYLSEKTIKHAVSEILNKLGLGRRVEAATFAIRRAVSHGPGG